jgi:hypothetical protein
MISIFDSSMMELPPSGPVRTTSKISRTRLGVHLRCTLLLCMMTHPLILTRLVYNVIYMDEAGD